MSNNPFADLERMRDSFKPDMHITREAMYALLDEFKRVQEGRDALAAQLERIREIAHDEECPESIREEVLLEAINEAPTASLASLIDHLADRLEEAEGPDAESGYMWDAGECANWLREQARRLVEESKS